MPSLARVQINPQYVIDLRYRQGLYLGYIPTNIGDAIDVDDASKMIVDDDVVTHSINLLSMQAIGDEITVDCSNKKLANILNFMLGNISSFSYARKTLVQTGTLFGLSLQRKIYSYKKIPGIPYSWKMIDRFQEIDKKNLRIERSVSNRNQMYWTIWTPEFDKYVILEDKADNPYVNDRYSLQGYMWYIHNYEEDKPYFKGIADAIYRLVYKRSKILGYWLDMCETWAGPMFISKIDSAKASTDPDLISGSSETLDTYKQNMIDALSQMKHNKSLVIDKSDEVKVIEQSSTGNNIHKEYLEYLDKRITLCILGTELASQSGKGGSYALGQVQENITLDTIKYSQKRMGQTIKEDIINDFLIRNDVLLKMLGIDFREEVITLHIQSETAYSKSNKLPYNSISEEKKEKSNVKI